MGGTKAGISGAVGELHRSSVQPCMKDNLVTIFCSCVILSCLCLLGESEMHVVYVDVVRKYCFNILFGSSYSQLTFKLNAYTCDLLKLLH